MHHGRHCCWADRRSASSCSSPCRCLASTHSSTPAARRRPDSSTAPIHAAANQLPGRNRRTLCIQGKHHMLPRCRTACITSGDVETYHSQRGMPMRPRTASAPAGLRKPLAITAVTHQGASLKQPLFHAAPPPCSMQRLALDCPARMTAPQLRSSHAAQRFQGHAGCSMNPAW